MAQYKIADLENLSGIKAHTIRIWEKRYNLLNPLRTETNIRYYGDDDLKKLLNIASLLQAGHKISNISKLNEVEIAKQIEEIHQTGGQGIKEETLINQLISAGLSFNEQQFDKAFSNCILSFGIGGSYQRVLYPMLNRIGLLWTTEDLSPAQEHFISNLIRQKLFVAIEAIDPAPEHAEKWLLFLPENEEHELGLLIANHILRSNNKKVYYLGTNVPMNSLLSAFNQIQPDRLLLFQVRPHQSKALQEVLIQLHQNTNATETVLCCSPIEAKQLTPYPEQHFITSFDRFLELCRN
ncbi:MAG: MerR family transcriptional regulator [Flavobacteriales bacterium]|nr:MerR family transcriptional regulator [Flavobacteriales bacterium]